MLGQGRRTIHRVLVGRRERIGRDRHVAILSVRHHVQIVVTNDLEVMAAAFPIGVIDPDSAAHFVVDAFAVERGPLPHACELIRDDLSGLVRLERFVRILELTLVAFIDCAGVDLPDGIRWSDLEHVADESVRNLATELPRVAHDEPVAEPAGPKSHDALRCLEGDVPA